MTTDPRANLTALIAALTDALAALEAAQPPHPNQDAARAVTDPEEEDTEAELTPIPVAARRLGISRSAAYRLAETGEVPIVEFGRRRYFVTAALRELIHNKQADGGRAAA